MISRYSKVKTKTNDNGKVVYTSTTLPIIQDRDDDIYIIANSMDRLDTLAYKFYGNAKYWWVIALANNLGKGTLMLEGGTQLRIPPNPTDVAMLLENANK